MYARKTLSILFTLLLCVGLMAGCDNEIITPSGTVGDGVEAQQESMSKAAMSYDNGVTRYDGVTAGDNIYAFLVPDEWNGDLVLYAHGFIDAARPLELPTNDSIEDIRDLIVENGYAFAYCSYRENGLAVKDGGRATRNLASLFRATVKSQPEHTWLVGHSLGGLIAVELAEKHPSEFDGVLTLAGMIGGSALQLDYVADVRILFDFFYPGVLPGSVLDVPDDLTVDDIIAAVVPAVMADPSGAFIISQLVCLPAPSNEALVQSLITALAFDVRGIRDVLWRTHGECPIDNMDKVYHTDNPMVPQSVLDAVNLYVQRYDRTDGADAEMRRNYEPNGRLAIPMIAVHREWDPTVPKCSAIAYEEKVIAAGNGDFFELRTVYEYGHSDFDPQLVFSALQDLISQAAAAGAGPIAAF